MKNESRDQLIRNISDNRPISDIVHLATINHEMLGDVLIRPFKEDLEKRGELRWGEDAELSLHFHEKPDGWNAEVFMKHQQVKKIFIVGRSSQEHTI